MKLIQSFGYAFKGLLIAFQQRNMRIHLAMTVLVLIAGWFFTISAGEWVTLGLCIGLVISIELLNTALEKLCDALTSSTPDLYPMMGVPKDIGAGAVLIAALIAAIVGCTIFVPHLLTILGM